jgi:small subunit ribosomal protein S14
MARKALVENNALKARLIKRYAQKRAELKAIINVRDDTDEAFKARMKAMRKLAAFPRNASPVRYRNRCGLSGRSRGFYRQFGISRIALRDLASQGQLPGVRKSSW